MKLNDTWLRWFGPVGLYVFISIFFRLDLYVKIELSRLITNVTVALLAGLICWQLARWVVLRLQQRCPGLANTRKRLVWLLLALPVLVGNAWLLRHLFRFAITSNFVYYSDPIELSRNLGIQIFYHFIYFSIYEGWYIMREWQRETIEMNMLEKLSLQSQLASLQQQVNPHFLFNSLNSLSSLISENPMRADAFLEELTAVFRYLLQASERQVVPLRDELTFMRSYSHLLETRYQQGVVFDVAIDPSHESLLMPPLALQVLVENAVRYNLILPEKPLRIHIYSEADQRLSVANTLQRKTLRVDTGGTNLSNLSTQYRLLGQRELLIKENPDWFIISLPLLSGEILDAGA